MKKLHKYWLDFGVIDASQSTYWRSILFESSLGERFPIDGLNCEHLDKKTVAAITKYGLEYWVSVVDGSETDSWLSENGMVVFKFWAQKFPTVKMFSGNNPNVL